MSVRPRSQNLNPRKLPIQERSAETVGVILEAAARILEERGFEGYNTNEVARRAGVSIGSLYQYFPGKDALTKALIIRETTIFLSDIRESADHQQGTSGVIQLIRAAVAHQLRRPTLARLLDRAELRLPLDDEVRRVSAEILSILEILLAKPDLPRVPNIPTAVRDLLALVKGIVDAAGEYGDLDSVNLEHRVRCAVFGYLDHQAGTPYTNFTSTTS